MYIRIAEFTTTSEINFDMLVSFFETKMIPRNLKAGQLSGEIFRTGPTSGFVISKFHSKIYAEKIMQLMRAELIEIQGTTKIKLLEGDRIFSSEEVTY